MPLLLPCKAPALSLAVIVVVEAVKNKFELLDFRLDMTLQGYAL